MIRSTMALLGPKVALPARRRASATVGGTGAGGTTSAADPGGGAPAPGPGTHAAAASPTPATPAAASTFRLEDLVPPGGAGVPLVRSGTRASGSDVVGSNDSSVRSAVAVPPAFPSMERNFGQSAPRT